MHVPYLHNFGQHCLVKVVLKCGLGKVALVDVFFFILYNGKRGPTPSPTHQPSINQPGTRKQSTVYPSTYQVKGAAVVVLLEVFVLALGLLVGDLPGV